MMTSVLQALATLLLIGGSATSLFVAHSGWYASVAGFLVCLLLPLTHRWSMQVRVLEPFARAIMAGYTRYSCVFTPLVIGSALLVPFSLITMFVASGEAGTGMYDGLAVFAAREHYCLNSHGSITEVPRWRYLLVECSFVYFWHALGLLTVLDSAKRSSR